MTVIDFPERNKRLPLPSQEPELGSSVDTAFEVHRMICNGLQMEPFREHPGALGSVLTVALTKEFGPDLVHWAEQQFELVYGTDPYTFIDHVTSYRD